MDVEKIAKRIAAEFLDIELELNPPNSSAFGGGFMWDVNSQHRTSVNNPAKEIMNLMKKKNTLKIRINGKVLIVKSRDSLLSDIQAFLKKHQKEWTELD
jgi:hypothetical protein